MVRGVQTNSLLYDYLNRTKAGAELWKASHTRGTWLTNHQRFGEALALGLAAGAPTGDGDEITAGALACGLAAAEGLATGDGAPPGDVAGLKPRLLGLLNIVLARLLVILASFIATSRSAALRISFR